MMRILAVAIFASSAALYAQRDGWLAQEVGERASHAWHFASSGSGHARELLLAAQQALPEAGPRAEFASSWCQQTLQEARARASRAWDTASSRCQEMLLEARTRAGQAWQYVSPEVGRALQALRAAWARAAGFFEGDQMQVWWERCQRTATQAATASRERLPVSWRAAIVAVWERCQRGAAWAWERLPASWQGSPQSSLAGPVVALAGLLALAALWAARRGRARAGAARSPPAGEAGGARAQRSPSPLRPPAPARSRADSPAPSAKAAPPQAPPAAKKAVAAKPAGEAAAGRVALAPTPARRQSRAASPAPSAAAPPAELAVLALLNHGSHQDLVELKGVGDKTARAIIRYRENNGEIHRLEDLVRAGTMLRMSVQTLLRSAA